MTPKEILAGVRDEQEKLRKVLEDAGYRVEDTMNANIGVYANAAVFTLQPTVVVCYDTELVSGDTAAMMQAAREHTGEKGE